MPDVQDLATLLREAVHSWAAEASVKDTLAAIAHSAVQTVPGTEHAGVSVLIAPHLVTTAAATGEVVRAADAAQTSVGQGPGLEAMRERARGRVDDLAADPRWPAFKAEAAALGVRSVLAFGLFAGADSWGTLNLYSRHPHAFGDGSEFVGVLFASHAAIALAGSQELAEVNEALRARDLIGQAKGILMERHDINGEAAFAMLVSTSHNSRMKVAEVAAWLAETGRDAPG